MEIVTKLRYQRGRRIGKGHFSEVFLANDLQLAGSFAVKEIPKENFSSPNQYFDEAKRMFASDCPSVVPIRAACESDTHICLLMPLFARGSLADCLANEGSLPLREVVRVGQDILAGLNQIHRANLLHLDVKPSNVLFSDAGAALVADFGQSVHIGPDGATRPRGLYTRHRPPEAITGGSVSVAADIYHAGLTLYRSLNGDRAFESQFRGFVADEDWSRLDEAIVRGKFPDRKAFRPDAPARLRKVIRKALEVNPSQRYSTALEMADDLAGVHIPLNWKMTSDDAGECRWTADRAQQPAYVVDLKRNGIHWDVRLHTENNGILRKKDVAAYWKVKQSRIEAERHLNSLFARLG